jgi:hypothetical protein
VAYAWYRLARYMVSWLQPETKDQDWIMKTELKLVTPDPDMMMLEINTLTDMATVVKVMELLTEDCEERKDEPTHRH